MYIYIQLFTKLGPIMSSGEDKIRSKIKEIEVEYARTQKNKATEGHLGILKAKLSKLRRELVTQTSIVIINVCV